MRNHNSSVLFFAGTDTDVGKTYTASLAAAMLRDQGYRVGVYKPVASGCEENGGCEESGGTRIATDAVALWEAAGKPRSLDDVCPQRFLAPLAPPEAARAEGKTVDVEAMRTGLLPWLGDEFDITIVEGAGGLMSPLSDNDLNLDWIRRISDLLSIDFPSTRLATVIVTANRLGVIHQTLATVAAANHHGLPVSGVILSNPTPTTDDSAATNASQIAKFCDVPVLGEISHGASHEEVTFLKTKLITYPLR